MTRTALVKTEQKLEVVLGDLAAAQINLASTEEENAKLLTRSEALEKVAAEHAELEGAVEELTSELEQTMERAVAAEVQAAELQAVADAGCQACKGLETQLYDTLNDFAKLQLQEKELNHQLGQMTNKCNEYDIKNKRLERVLEGKEPDVMEVIKEVKVEKEEAVQKSEQAMNNLSRFKTETTKQQAELEEALDTMNQETDQHRDLIDELEKQLEAECRARSVAEDKTNKEIDQLEKQLKTERMERCKAAEEKEQERNEAVQRVQIEADEKARMLAHNQAEKEVEEVQRAMRAEEKHSETTVMLDETKQKLAEMEGTYQELAEQLGALLSSLAPADEITPTPEKQSEIAPPTRESSENVEIREDVEETAATLETEEIVIETTQPAVKDPPSVQEQVAKLKCSIAKKDKEAAATQAKLTAMEQDAEALAAEMANVLLSNMGPAGQTEEQDEEVADTLPEPPIITEAPSIADQVHALVDIITESAAEIQQQNAELLKAAAIQQQLRETLDDLTTQTEIADKTVLRLADECKMLKKEVHRGSTVRHKQRWCMF